MPEDCTGYDYEDSNTAFVAAVDAGCNESIDSCRVTALDSMGRIESTESRSRHLALNARPSTGIPDYEAFGREEP